MHNTVKHAQARKVTVELTEEDGRLVLRIPDDGIGFDTAGDFHGHLGLRSMAERTARVSGRLSIESSPGAGTRIAVDVPCEPGHLPGEATPWSVAIARASMYPSAAQGVSARRLPAWAVPP